MATLKEISQDILDEKTLKIIPENIKKGITIFDIVGSYEGSGPSRRIKLFETISDMNNDPDAQENDLAIIYANNSGHAAPGVTVSEIIFPDIVTVSEIPSSSESCYGDLADSNYSFDIMFSNYSFEFEIRDMSSYDTVLRASYSSYNEDGTYTLSGIYDASYSQIDNPVTLPSMLTFPSDLTSDMGLFFQIGVLSYDGLYEYINNTWSIAPTQLNITNADLFKNYKAFDGTNMISNGTFNISYNVPMETFMNKVNYLNEIYGTPWELDASITDLSYLTNNPPSDFPVINMSNVTNIYQMFTQPNGSYADEREKGAHLDAQSNNSSYTNFAKSVPFANQLTSPFVKDFGLDTSNFNPIAQVILSEKGYIDALIPNDTSKWTNYYIVKNGNGTTYNIPKDPDGVGSYDRFGKELFEFIWHNSGNLSFFDYGEQCSLSVIPHGYSDPSSSTYTLDFSGMNTSGIMRTDRAFAGYTDIKNIPVFDTSNVINMAKMFDGCWNLNKAPDFNTSKVTNMYRMYANCRNLSPFTSNNYSNFDMSNVIDASYMFYDCDNFKTFDYNGLNNVKNISHMFADCDNFERFNSFNLAGVEDVSYLFDHDYKKLNSMPANLELCDVTNMAFMYNDCENLWYVPNFLNTNNVTNTANMFSDCKNLRVINLFNTAKSTNFSNMFYTCNNLTNIPAFDTSNGKDLGWMFAWCRNLTSVPNFNTTNAECIDDMFIGCNNLTTLPNLDLSNIISAVGAFVNCIKVTIIPDFNCCNLVNAQQMFQDLPNVHTFPNIIFGKVNSFKYCFVRSGFTDLSEANIDTSTATLLYGMFNNSTLLTKAPNLNLNNALDVGYMFAGCVNLTTVPEYNLQKAINIGGMFAHCKNLSDASIQNIINMCLNCSNVTNQSQKCLTNNTYSVGIFYNAQIANTRYQNRWDELTAAGWIY